MKPSDLLALDRLSGSPLVNVQQQDPELFAQLSAKAADERRQTVTAAFTGVSPQLQDAIGNVDYSLGDRPERPLREVIFDSLAAQQVPVEVAGEAVTRVLELERSSALVDPAAVTTAIHDHPLFQGELQQAGVVKVALAAGLEMDRAGRMLDTVATPDMLDDAAIGDAVQADVLDQQQAADVGVTATLYHLSDDQVEVARRLRRGLADTAAPGTVLAGLPGLGVQGWQAAIDRGGVTPPNGLSAAEFAARLDRTVSALFPTDALLQRILPPEDPEDLRGLIEHGDHGELTAVANAHPGLRIDEIIAGDLPAAEKAQAIAENLELVRKVYQLNPSTELLTLDYTPDSDDLDALQFGDLSPDQTQMVVSDLKAYQRAFALTDDVADACTLLQAGYHSAVAVGTGTLEVFQAKTGLAPEVALGYYEAAKADVAKLTTSVLSVTDVLWGGFADIEIANLSPSIADYLRKLDGFADLLGSQDFCSCSHCQSILSPAAYFVDLMSFVDEHVTQVHFTGTKATDVLNLKVRRPDLWTLPLTCENTDTLVPYLDLINEICENYLASRLGFGGNLADRAAVEDFVYRQHLAVTVDSFAQPFTLPLERLAAYLAHFERTRVDVADALAAPTATRTAAALGLAKREFTIITQPNTDLDFLRRVYGVNFTVGATGVVDPLEVQELLPHIGLTREQLGDLVTTAFVTAGGAEPIQIVTAKRSPDSVQNDVERIQGLRATSLDRLHRFTRLTRAVSRPPIGPATGPEPPRWTTAETDLIVAQLAATGGGAGLDPQMLASIVDVAGVGRRFTLSAEQNCALWGPIPRMVLAGTTASLFDRLFNLPTFVRLDGTLPKDTVSFVHPSLRTGGVPSPADNTLHRLLAALGIADDQLAALITELAGPLGANLGAPNEDDRGFLLTTANLTLLYRHARLAQLLRLKVADLFALASLTGLTHVASLVDLLALLTFADWWRGSGYSLDDLALITHATVQRPAAYPDPAALAATIVSRIQADKDLEFAATVFAFVPGVTEDQSREVVTANTALFEPTTAGALRLAATFDPTAPLTVPAGVTVAEPTLRAALLTHHAATVLPPRLAAQLSLAADRVGPLVAMTGVQLASAPVVQALHGGPIAPLVDLIGKLIPLAVLFKAPVYDAGALSFLGTHGGVFGIADYTAVDVTGIRRLSVYASVAAATLATDFTPVTPPLAPADVWHVFATFDPALGFANTDKQRLAATLRTDPALIATLLPHLTLPASASEALDMLARCVALTTYLGVDGDSLTRILSDDYTDLSRASEAILSAFRAKYPDEAQFVQTLTPFEDVVRGRKRDGLTDHLIRSTQPGFGDLDSIYEYLLVDCQLDGCARTSRLVAAISSVQLYVHRILLNLEQDDRDPSDPLRTAIPPGAIPADEWTWRKNYRVWEANRKVFLWPENYIEPELRDDKTPLFTELESTLLQQQITEQNVLDAYGRYLSGLEEVANLQVAGAYHHKDSAHRTDLLHLFGVTPGDPPLYYYRTIRNAHYGELDAGRGVSYGPWKKIDVQIPVRKVAPVVYLGRLFVFWVEIVTTPKNEVKDAGSTFVGYKHRLALKYTTLRLDGGWTPPQAVSLSGGAFPTGDGIVEDPLSEQAERDAFNQALRNFNLPAAYQAYIAMQTPRYDTKPHSEPVDGYTVSGFQWEQVYPEVIGSDLLVTGRNFIMRAGVDFYRKAITPRWQFNVHAPGTSQVLSSRNEAGFYRLYASRPWFYVLDDYAQASIIADQRRIDTLGGIRETAWVPALVSGGLFASPLAWLLSSPDTSVVNGSVSDGIVDLDGDLLYLQGSVRPGSQYLAKRIGTTLGEQLSRQLFTGGVDGLLATSTQLALRESPPPLVTSPQLSNGVVSGKVDYRGSFGTYYREAFFHIPFLIANHLNSQQRFDAAQAWYHYILDPTASDIEAASVSACGTTIPGATNWQPYAGGAGIYCDVDTSAAGLTETPLYLTSLSGDSVHWELTGINAIYNATPTGFRIYLRNASGGAQPTPQEANDFRWAVQWAAVPQGPRSGSTVPGATDWQVYAGGAGIYCDVDTSGAGLTETPLYLTSLSGVAVHWELTGITAIYNATATGFRIYLRNASGGAQPTPEQANQFRWAVQWVAVPRGPRSGSTVPGATDWQPYAGGGGVYCDVDTSAAGLTDTPQYLTSLSGDGVHWELTGITAIYNATPTGFRIYLRSASGGAQPTPQQANDFRWAVQWTPAQHVVDEERRRRRRDRVWRYAEFRGLEVPRLREVLTDPAAIEAYKKDPFNPHAIARLRLSAYQKCIVMRYIDNLLDWGDSLFNQFTMESVNEATMLYVAAGQLLGRRPARLATCGEGAVTPRTYETIAPLVAKGSKFLVELENFIWASTNVPSVYGKAKKSYTFAADRATVRYFGGRVARASSATLPLQVIVDETVGAAAAADGPPEVIEASKAVATANAVTAVKLADDRALAYPADWNRTYISSWADADGQGALQVVGNDRPLITDFERVPVFGWSVIRQLTPVFCVPNNRELLGYWDRVEDRLFKIRHCLDISGVPRQLALFAPEIDPRLLVRARAAGLSIEDVLGATSGDLPPYRFQYLIEKAKQHAGVVQSFGAALLSALEKRDLEELNRLRIVHQQNLQKLTTRVREWEIDIAADAVETLARQTTAVQYRHDYYKDLLAEDLTAWERTQQIARHTASVLSGAAALVDTLAGVVHLVPQLGSPFAMKYGGLELGSSADSWSGVAKDAASVAEAVSSSAGLEAGFERRRDGWEHQRKLAEHELEQLQQQSVAAELRRQIAVRSLELHQEGIDQLEEIFELYGTRFSTFALYSWLSTTLQRLYREAYNSAYATARLAEQAYRFERGDETTPLLRGQYFDAGKAGLLAGEQLHIDLETMERRFIETNYRTPEIDQSFSLTQIDPAALLRLRQTGECSFQIPEVFFDLFYPGQYRRRIRSVRLTMPCVTGPYTNVGATLALTGSSIRREPKLGAAGLVDVPVRRSVAIATSTAQNDAGVFEFSFRDERYMPFEGAGAVSSWRLILPKSFRPFDYQTLTDVIVHISYTAESDEVFRGKVEQLNATIDGTILNFLSNNAITRVYSLRQDFSTAFNRLLHSATGTAVPFELTDRHLPIFLRGRNVSVTVAKLLLRTAAGQSASGVTVRLDTEELSAFTHDPTLGNLFSADVTTVFTDGLLGTHTLTVVAAGALAPEAPDPGDHSALDEGKLLDLQLYVETKVAST